MASTVKRSATASSGSSSGRRQKRAVATAVPANSTRTAILVYDFWEKLAGASLALASAVHLCRLARAALVQPFVESSMLVPFPGAGRLPLSAYYSVPHLQKSLAPSSLLSITHAEPPTSSYPYTDTPKPPISSIWPLLTFHHPKLPRRHRYYGCRYLVATAVPGV